jgi:hypothetical protein
MSVCRPFKTLLSDFLIRAIVAKGKVWLLVASISLPDMVPEPALEADCCALASTVKNSRSEKNIL